ncbi:MAG: response regulator transcription factor [Verrucomicrobiales bacterium]|nr:response regulator transcription factor [Verrucomicrobiales bacterium]
MSTVEVLWLISRDRSLRDRFERLSKTIVHPFEQSKQANTPSPEVVIVDSDDYEVEDCVDLTAKMRSHDRSVPIMVLTSEVDPEVVFPLLRAGASSFLLKTSNHEELGSSLHNLVNGNSPVSPEIATLILEAARRSLPVSPDKMNLKPRDVELLRLLADGLTKKDISEKFDRSVHTVDNHIRRIYSKLGVKNLGAAVGQAFRSGVIT